MIQPHGGTLINRLVEGDKKKALEARLSGMKKLVLNQRETADLEMIATGAMSPLEGFMTEEQYRGVLADMRLPGGLAWSLPVSLAVKNGSGEAFEIGSEVALCTEEGSTLGVLHLESKYRVDKTYEARQALGTDDEAHPGVQYLKTVGDVYLAGNIDVLQLPRHEKFLEYRLAPKQTRELFKSKGWKTVVAFQTRNPIHRAHEYLQKCALEICDGLLIHPLMGETKSDDIPADVRMKCYQVLVEKYFVKDRVAITVFPAAMRYAGPREAIFHSLVRKNYGCTHFIVGRDHAGVGNYYGTYEAQEIFDRFDPAEIGITPLMFEHAFYCKLTGGMATTKTSPATAENKVFLSGTKVREMLHRGEVPPVEFTRPEVAQILIDFMRNKQD
jgi:ATP sulfurylase